MSGAGRVQKIAPTSGQSSSIPPANPGRIPPKRNVSSACVSCRQSKKKCNGERPCGMCVARGVACTYSENSDRRRREQRKDKFRELEDDSKLLHSLLETIRDSSDDQVQQIVALVRSNGPVSEIKSAVQQSFLDSREAGRDASPELDRLGNYLSDIDTPDNFPPNRMDISRLTDTPPYQLLAAPWTSVTTDDTLVSNLISVYLTWEQPFYNWIDLDAFVHAMKSKDLRSAYCSPFLVNAFLAAACPYSDYAEATLMHNNSAASVMPHFVSEAKLHLERESDELSITKLQGLCFMMCASGVMGNDADGWEYMQQAITTYKAILSNYASILATAQSPSEEEVMARVLAKTCWGVFNNLVMSLGAWQRTSELKPPQAPLLKTTTSHDWTPYPLSDESKPAYVEELAYFHSKLSIIATAVNELLYSDDTTLRMREDKEMSREIMELHTRLVDWRSGLPKYLDVSGDAAPSVLTHQSYYHVIVINLLSPITTARCRSSTEDLDLATQWRREAASAIVRIIRIHQEQYGMAHMSIFFIQPVTFASFTLVDRTDEHDNKAELIDLCVFFRAMSRRYPFATAALRMFQLTVQRQGKTLPVETQKLFEDFENRDWKKRQLERVRSLYPAIADREDGDGEVRNMSEVFAQFESLRVTES